MNSRNRILLTAPIVALTCAAAVGCRSFYGAPTGVAVPQAGLPVGSPTVVVAPGPGPMMGPDVAPSLVGDAPPGVIVSEPTVVVPPPSAVGPSGPASRWFAPLAGAQLTLAPQTVVAPVGSEVVLLATVMDGRGGSIAGQRVEWMLSPDSAGQFMALGAQGRTLNWHGGNKGKRDNHYAVGNTESRIVTLTRGTPTQVDDVIVQRGQAWISVSSSTDGTSHVTAMAPQVPAWDQRKGDATIYWVDAQFSFPAPAIGGIGTGQLFNTIVTRSSDGSPLEGYLVRYVISGGPPAAFAPSGATELEVPTDANGHAAVEIVQAQPARGENSIQVEVIRPAGFAGSTDRRLVIGRGSTMMTWTAPDIALHVTGPAEADVGSSATYRFQVTNTGDAPVTQVTLNNRIPPGLRFQNSTTQPESSANGLAWQLGELAAGLSQTIEVNYEVTRAGTIENCATVNSAEGVRAEDCATMSAALPSLELKVTGPQQVTVGQRATFAISVTNRTGSPVANVVIKDTFDSGLAHDVAESPIERDLGTLGVGETRDDVAVTFRVTRPGRVCHTVEVSAEGIRPSQAVSCVEGIGGGGAPAARSGLSVRKTGPAAARVGDSVLFEINVANTGETTLTNVRIVDNYEQGLRPVSVSAGYKIENEQLTWQFAELRPGDSKRLQVEVRCDEAVRACSRATVTADGDLIMADEACLQIEAVEPPPIESRPPLPPAEPAPQPTPTTPPVTPPPTLPPTDGTTPPDAPPGTPGTLPFEPGTPPASAPAVPADGAALSIQMTDLRDEVSVGRAVIYEVTITNRRNVADRNVELVLNLPAGLSAVSVGTVAPSRHTVRDSMIRFNPVAEIRPGESLIYRIPVRADRAGRFVVEAKAISAAQQSAVVASEETNIFAER